MNDPRPIRPPDEPLRLAVAGALDRLSVLAWHRRIQDALRQAAREPGRVVQLDLAQVARMDSAGAALVQLAARRAAALHVDWQLVAASAAAQQALQVFAAPDAAAPPPAKPSGALGFFARVGGRHMGQAEGFVQALALGVDTFYFALVGLWRRRERVRLGALVEQGVRIGSDAVGIVALVTFLVGLTVALQSAYQLRQFGANIFIADLVGVAMTREMGPLMTAIIVAGRSGSAIAAEISTMVISEEVDALRTMGVEPVRYIVVPKFLAITVTQPLLTTLANLCGILGAFVIAILYLDLNAEPFLRQLQNALVVRDLMTGLVKSVAFAWIIVFVGAHKGFRARGGAVGVGLATTSSVVTAIFSVIVADCIFSVIFYFGD